MKKVCYYHIYLSDEVGMWSNILLEQIKYMEESNLLNELDQIKINCVTQNDHRIQLFTSLLKTSVLNEKNIEVKFFQNAWKNDFEMSQNLESNQTVTENITIQNFWNDCQTEDMQILYIHSKAVTSVVRVLMQGNPQLFRQNYYGRQFLNWGVLSNWRTCVEALETHDVASVNYQKEYPCFAGSFYWANSSYIRTLPDPSKIEWLYKRKEESNNAWLKYQASERFKEEQWILSNKDAKIYDMITLNLPEEDPFLTYFPPLKYITREKNPTKYTPF